MAAQGNGKKWQTFDEDDIVRYSMGLEVPIVGLVRNRDEYKEMREIALIYGFALGLKKAAAASAEEERREASDEESPASEAPGATAATTPAQPEAAIPAVEGEAAVSTSG
jgi:hypothetical protein